MGAIFWEVHFHRPAREKKTGKTYGSDPRTASRDLLRVSPRSRSARSRSGACLQEETDHLQIPQLRSDVERINALPGRSPIAAVAASVEKRARRRSGTEGEMGFASCTSVIEISGTSSWNGRCSMKCATQIFHSNVILEWKVPELCFNIHRVSWD